MKLTKRFTQGYFYIGGGNNEWKNIDETYEEAAKRLATGHPLYERVREVEKVLDTETFEVAIAKTIRATQRKYVYDKGYYKYEGTIETIYEE